ncbi:MAG: hypothetical protein Q7I94_04705, partial [Candidatus Contubernalis sp.]|nr:hypothetical protein [Candidatus Contubernalis sp.]
RTVCKTTPRFLVVESAYGQLARLVKEALFGLEAEMDSIFMPGLGITSEKIVAHVKKDSKIKINDF